ncbi:MAG: hypothetical protein NVSMB23_04500 [Myxococcales bacterium]
MASPSSHGAVAIETRYLLSGGERVPVELHRSARGSVAARFFLGPGQAPIIDAPTAEAALDLVQCAIDVLVPARPGSRG